MRPWKGKKMRCHRQTQNHKHSVGLSNDAPSYEPSPSVDAPPWSTFNGGVQSPWLPPTYLLIPGTHVPLPYPATSGSRSCSNPCCCSASDIARLMATNGFCNSWPLPLRNPCPSLSAIRSWGTRRVMEQHFNRFEIESVSNIVHVEIINFS